MTALQSKRKEKSLSELAQRIRAARRNARLSQDELGKSIGLSDKSISAYEQGRSMPPLDKLKKIAEIQPTLLLTSPKKTLIMVHNHPSGDPTPSDDDIRFTTRIHEAGELIGIPMVDHVIVAKSGYFSFRDNKTS